MKKRFNKVRHTRFLYGMTQKEFAGILGYTQSWLARLEGGKVPISQRLDMLLDKMIEEKKP